jgi:hypothetical protein
MIRALIAATFLAIGCLVLGESIPGVGDGFGLGLYCVLSGVILALTFNHNPKGD